METEPTDVTGLNVQIFNDGKALSTLPDGSGIQLGFPVSEDDQFAVLHWNGSMWIEITQKTNEDNVSSLVDANPANELYQLESADGNFYQVLTTEKTGTFILVKK